MAAFEHAVAELFQILVVQLGLFLLGTGITPLQQQSIKPQQSQCIAQISVFQKAAILQHFMVVAMFISAIFICLVRYRLKAAGELSTLNLRLRLKLRILMFAAVAMSLVSVVLAAFTYYYLIEVKVSVFACLNVATKIFVYAAYVISGACCAFVYHDLFTTVVYSD